MPTVLRHLNLSRGQQIALLCVAIVTAAGALYAWNNWGSTPSVSGGTVAGHEDGHDHEHAEHGHEEQSEIAISDKALKNIGYEPVTVTLGSFDRTISLPGIVVERPGKSQVRVSAPVTGVVTSSDVIEGQAVEHGSPLFEVRLTHEDLVDGQGEFLEAAQSLDIVNSEIKRLEAVTEGVIAGRRIVEQKYEKQKLEAKLNALRQALLLHGLSEEQIAQILKTRQLLPTLTIFAPTYEECPNCHNDHPFHVQSVNIQIGQQVKAGDTMAILADHCELYIEGTAFEADAPNLRTALDADSPISADILVSTKREHAVNNLKLLYLSDQVDRESRALHFYVLLPNEIVSDRKEESQRFVQWRFRPGQRVELSIPVEKWEKRLVVPADAVVNDGAETYVYRQSGDHFHRVPVHVEHRGQKSVIIANDGAISPGEVIAGHGAFQIHLALKNKSGGAPDPHAGHNH